MKKSINKLGGMIKSNRHTMWVFIHTMGLSTLLFAGGIIPFFNPKETSPSLEIIRDASPLIQVFVLLIGIRVMGMSSTFAEGNAKKSDCSKVNWKQIISKNEFGIIVLMSAIIVVLLGLKIKFSVGDDSGITWRLFANIGAILVGLWVTPDEVFAGKVNIFGFSRENRTLSEIQVPYDTLAASLIAMIFLWFIISVSVTHDIRGLSLIKTRIISVCAFFVAINVLHLIAINNKG